MCCWFSRTATRRISCTDQRIKATVPSVPASHRPGSGGWHGLWLLGSHCLGIQAMADCRQHGKGQHDQRDVPVPAVPRAGLIMVKSQFILRRLKSILDGPTMALDPDQRLNGGARGAPGGEKGHLAIGKVTSDQQAPRPQPRPVLAILIGLEVNAAAENLARR